MKLVSMIDFVGKKAKQGVQAGRLYNKRQTDILFEIYKYRTFLNQPLSLGMFVPAIEVDGKWEVLEEPKVGRDKKYSVQDKSIKSQIWHQNWHEKIEQYQQAKDRVLFEGFEFIEKDVFTNDLIFNHNSRYTRITVFSIIESLSDLEPTLTAKGQELSGLK